MLADQNIYERFSTARQRAQSLADTLAELQSSVTSLQEKNAELTIENERLRGIIKQQQGNKSSDNLTASRENLKKHYQQGFHVCNEYFGKHLAKNESCTFCLDTIFGRHTQPTPGPKE